VTSRRAISGSPAARSRPPTAAYEALNDAVTACYGFAPGCWRDESATLAALLELSGRVAGGGS